MKDNPNSTLKDVLNKKFKEKKGSRNEVALFKIMAGYFNSLKHTCPR